MEPRPHRRPRSDAADPRRAPGHHGLGRRGHLRSRCGARQPSRAPGPREARTRRGREPRRGAARPTQAARARPDARALGRHRWRRAGRAGGAGRAARHGQDERRGRATPGAHGTSPRRDARRDTRRARLTASDAATSIRAAVNTHDRSLDAAPRTRRRRAPTRAVLPERRAAAAAALRPGAERSGGHAAVNPIRHGAESGSRSRGCRPSGGSHRGDGRDAARGFLCDASC